MAKGQLAGLLYLIVFAPLVGAAVNGLFSRWLSRRTVSIVGVGTPFVSFLAALYCFGGMLALRSAEPEFTAISSTLFSWIQVGSFSFDFSLYLDPLSMVMVLVVTGVGSVIHLYSVGYMHDDPSYGRYFSHLNLFMFSMLLLVLGQNLLLLFVGWEGVGLCSYLLIGFWFDDMEKAIAGKKAFIVNRIGDFGFLLGMFVILFWLGGSLDVPTLKTALTGEGSVLAHKTFAITVVTLCLFLGATGKSAQIPLYVWLPDAMAGPTPVSALIHAATMVTAGVYMIARLNFLFVLAPVTMAVVAGIGALTALFAATIGLAQNDIKKVLAYSTVSQLGYMFLGVGMGAFAAGIFHLMTHAFFKACLFLGAGSVIHAMGGEQDIRKMGGLASKMPITRITFLLATLAIAGFPLFSGFFSKDEILYSALVSRHTLPGFPPFLGKLYFALGLGGALLTALYMFRLYFLTFSLELRSPDAHPHESPRVMTIPLAILGAGSVVAGFVGIPEHNVFEGFLGQVFEWSERYVNNVGTKALEFGSMGVSTLVALAGIFLAYMLYRGPWRTELEGLRGQIRWLVTLVANKYYVDEAYFALFVRPFQAVSRWTFRRVDAGLIDGVMVNGSAWAGRGTGRLLSLLQNGDVQSYVAAMIIGLAVLCYLVF